MISDESKSVSDKAKLIYDQGLRARLEATDWGRYVAIEPESGDHFLGDSLDDTVHEALEKYPNRLTHFMRISHQAALRLGGIAS